MAVETIDTWDDVSQGSMEIASPSTRTVSLSNRSIFILADGEPEAVSPADTIFEM